MVALKVLVLVIMSPRFGVLSCLEAHRVRHETRVV